MRSTCALIIVLSARLFAAPVPAVQDQSVANYKPPVRAPATDTVRSEPAVERIGPAISIPAPRVPPKVLLAMPNGFVTQQDGTFVFTFANAPMPEVVVAVASMFRAKIVYMGAATRSVSGEFRGQTIEQLLSRLVAGTDLRYGAADGGWKLGERDIPSVPITSLTRI